MSPSSRITYRIGDGGAPSVCVRHPGASVKFQCRGCLDWLCERCLARGETERCAVCREASERPIGVSPAGGGRLGSIARRAGIGTLVVVALLAAGTVVWSLRPGPPPVIDQAAMDRETVATLVEQRRDAQGLVPEDLRPYLSSLPPELARRVASGAIRYHVSPDRRTYDITVTPPADAR